MDSINLIKSGIDTVETLITYLAKDAIGGDFLKKYLESREAQAQAAQEQQLALQKLLEDTNEMEAGNRQISESVEGNIQRLGTIAQAIQALQRAPDNPAPLRVPPGSSLPGCLPLLQRHSLGTEKRTSQGKGASQGFSASLTCPPVCFIFSRLILLS